MKQTSVIYVNLAELEIMGPEGKYYATCYQKMVHPDHWIKVIIPIVAVQGDCGDYAAYIGFPAPEYLIPKWFQNYASQAKHTLEGCMKHGDKVSKAFAEVLFPGFAKFEYRG